VVDHGGPTTPMPMLVERVRAACSRSVCAGLRGADGAVTVLPLAPELEQMLRAQALPPGADGVAQFPFEAAERVASRLKAVLTALPPNQRAVLLTASDLRAGLQRQLRAFVPELVVLAHTEVDSTTPIRALGHLALHEGLSSPSSTPTTPSDHPALQPT
jgi:flagellar biosynthesis component FlhA